MGCPAAMIAQLFVHSTHVNSGGRETTSVDVHCSADSCGGPLGCLPPSWFLYRLCSAHSV